MAEREQAPSDDALRRALAELGERLAFPQAPDLAARIHDRLPIPTGGGTGVADEHQRIPTQVVAHPSAPVSSPAPQRLRPRWMLGRGRLLVAALGAALLLAVLLALIPGARAGIDRWLGLPGVIIVDGPAVPALLPSPVGGNLALGRRLPLAEVRRHLPFAVLIPALPAFRVPDEVYLGDDPAPGQVALVYRARPGLSRAASTGVGLLLTEFLGDPGVERFFIRKALDPGARLEQVAVHGQPGYWLTGGPHLFWYTGRDGTVRSETIRLAGNTLLWTQGHLTLRLESGLDRAAALRIAASIE